MLCSKNNFKRKEALITPSRLEQCKVTTIFLETTLVLTSAKNLNCGLNFIELEADTDSLRSVLHSLTCVWYSKSCLSETSAFSHHCERDALQVGCADLRTKRIGTSTFDLLNKFWNFPHSWNECAPKRFLEIRCRTAGRTMWNVGKIFEKRFICFHSEVEDVQLIPHNHMFFLLHWLQWIKCMSSLAVA